MKNLKRLDWEFLFFAMMFIMMFSFSLTLFSLPKELSKGIYLKFYEMVAWQAKVESQNQKIIGDLQSTRMRLDALEHQVKSLNHEHGIEEYPGYERRVH